MIILPGTSAVLRRSLHTIWQASPQQQEPSSEPEQSEQSLHQSEQQQSEQSLHQQSEQQQSELQLQLQLQQLSQWQRVWGWLASCDRLCPPGNKIIMLVLIMETMLIITTYIKLESQYFYNASNTTNNQVFIKCSCSNVHIFSRCQPNNTTKYLNTREVHQLTPPHGPDMTVYHPNMNTRLLH